jgi:hypothetical protein
MHFGISSSTLPPILECSDELSGKNATTMFFIFKLFTLGKNMVTKSPTIE